MSIFLLILIILLTLTNMAMGLFLAVELGYGPPTLRDALALLGFHDLVRSVKSGVSGGNTSVRELFRGLVGKIFKKKETVAASTEEQSQTPALNVEEMLKSVSEASVSDLLDDESDEIEMVAPLRELFDDDLATVLMDKGTEAWLMGEKHVETSILKLNVVMMKSGAFAAELDHRLRVARGCADATLANNSMTELRDDCTNYLTAQAEVTEQIQKRIDEFGELSYLAEEIEYANMEQAAQIETTISNIDQMNPEESEATVQKLLKELSKLRIARHRLRDQQEKAFLTVVRYEDRMDTIVPQLFVDEATGLRCRIGLEVTLLDWWKQKRQETRQICFALLDLTKFGEINDEYGIKTGDKVIKYLGRQIENEITSQDLAGVYYGNCFFIVTVNKGLRKTVSDVEKIRQGLERTNFTCDEGNNHFSLEITSAVTEALPKHTDQEVMKLMEKSILQAKKAGRNHTYLLDQSKLTPELEKVDSPNLGMDYITVDLDTIA